MSKSKLSWRDVFDSTKTNIHYIDDMVDFLKTTGYKYFCWNGDIFIVNDKYTDCIDTGFTVDDLD